MKYRFKLPNLWERRARYSVILNLRHPNTVSGPSEESSGERSIGADLYCL